MIDYISGKLTGKSPTSAVIEVNGLGYFLHVSLNTYQHLPQIGAQLRLDTYLHVREDALQLFGFGDQRERSIFTGLISVSGVGPRLAQTILSGIKPAQLVQAIQESDVHRLTSISGVGSKTAQRLIVDLKEKFVQLGLVSETDETPSHTKFTDVEEEALLALMSLGYKKSIVEKALVKIRKNGVPDTVEEIIKQALQQI